MLLIDDILLFPIRGVLWIFREINNAAQEEIADEAEAITAKLSELYMMLETGQMTEQEFDVQEKTLLDRLDAIKNDAADDEEEEETEGFDTLDGSSE